MPPSRCSVTMTGLSSMVTVHMPSIACNATNATIALGSNGDCRSARRFSHATTAIANISTPRVPAI